MIQLQRFADSWWHWITASSWQIALLVVLIAVAVRASSKLSPKLHYSLWLLVLAKAFLPPSLTLPTGIGSWGFGRLAWIGESQSPIDSSVLAMGEAVSTAPVEAGASVSTPLVLMGVWQVANAAGYFYEKRRDAA